MSTSGVVGRQRWRLPAKRKRFALIGMPIMFVIVFVPLVVIDTDEWWQSLTLALMFSGIVGIFAIGFARLEPDPETPGPRRVYVSRRQKRRLIEAGRRGLPVADDVADWMRPMAEQIGRESARGVLAMPAYLMVFGGLTLGNSRGWMTWLGVLIVIAVLLAEALMVRDRNACAAFLDRYGEPQPRA